MNMLILSRVDGEIKLIEINEKHEHTCSVPTLRELSDKIKDFVEGYI